MEVYRWARRHPGFAMAVKGRESIAAQQAIGVPSWQDVTIGGRTIRKGVRLWNIGTSMLKMELYGQLSLERPTDGTPPPDGFVFLPDGMTDELIKQLVAEELRIIRQRNGAIRREWHKIRDRNEELDNAVYARAVAISLGVDRWKPDAWKKLLELPPPPDPPAAKKKPATAVKLARATPARPRPTGNWLNRRGR